VQDVKASNIARLAGAMKRGKVQFATDLPQRDDIFRQFERWKPTAKNAKDDAPDCLAQIWDRYSDKIYPNTVNALAPSEPVQFAQEIVEPEEDTHSDEREWANMSLLGGMTVEHAR